MLQAVQITKEILEKMGFENADIQNRVVSGRIKIDIKVPDARSLIGERGATLAMLQHVVRRIFSKRYANTTSSSPPSPDLSDISATQIGSSFLPFKPLDSSYGKEQQIDIDINGYKVMREDILKDFAHDIAQKVRAQKKAVELDPMPSFDRRIVHLALSSFPDIATESMGEGNNRYIIVRLHP